MTSSFLSAGFRGFFWLGALNAAVSLVTWLAYLAGVGIGTQGWPAQTLHAHEMIYGTVVAAIAGFLLTSVPNWTGTRALRGAPIGALLALWMIGRVALTLGDVIPRALVALLDGAFLPALAVVIGVPIARSRKVRNFPVVGVLLALTVANASIHAGVIGQDATLLRVGTYGAVYLAVVLMLIISGRVVPLFTRNALQHDPPGLAVASDPRIGGAAIAAAVLAMAIDLAAPGSAASGWVAALAAPLILARQWHWRPERIFSRPILAILHVGHAWIAVGFGCHAASSLAGVFPGAAALHAFTAGAMGSLILGMMTRVSLGHTGRPVEASRVTVVAYLSVVFAAVVRVFGLLLAPADYLALLMLSGGAFAAAYLIFAVEFAPMLWRPRVGG